MRVRRTPSARRYYSLKGIRMNLRTLGLRKSSPPRADHPGIGQRCVLCKRAIRVGDRTGLVPPLDSEEPALAVGLICYWTCIESGLSRLRQGETEPGTTRRFVENTGGALSPPTP